MAEINRLQVFNLKLNELEVAEVVAMLMEFPGKRIYNLTKKLELQTIAQRALSEESKEWETSTILIKKEGT